MLIGVGCLLGAAANAAALVVGSPWALIATRLATGAALAWVYPPAMKVAAGWFRQRRGFALGVLVGALTLGKAMPHLVTAIFGAAWRTPIVFTSVAGGARRGCWRVTIVRDGPLLPADLAASTRGRVRPRVLGARRARWRRRLSRTHVGAVRDVGVGGGLRRRQPGGGGRRRAPAREAALVAFVAIGSGAARLHRGRTPGRRPGQGPRRPLGAGRLGRCAAWRRPLVFGRHPAWLYLLVAVWGFAVVADSAQFSALVSERAPADAIGTALTLQTSLGFLLTMVTIDVLPRVATLRRMAVREPGCLRSGPSRDGWRWGGSATLRDRGLGARGCRQSLGHGCGLRLRLTLDSGQSRQSVVAS